jgi:F420-dependent oxidoreductase-like protein
VSGLDLRIFTEPQQGATYDDLLAVATTAERLGFSAFFRSDHFLAVGTDGLPGPTDAWASLAGLARDTTTIRLGSLVSSATFRLPGPLAVAVATVDQMSGGRVELGLGSGWFEEEHRAYGIPFPALRERFDRLEEQLEIVTGLWSTPIGRLFSHSGGHYRLEASPGLPKPVQGTIPIIVGGAGARRTPELAAKFATEFNAPFLTVADATAQYARVDAACMALGRDPATITRSAALVACVGADSRQVERRAAAMGRDADTVRREGVAGTPGEAREILERWREAGCTRVYLQVLDLADLDHLELIAAELLDR